ncbi:MAG: hemolysin D [Thermoguttaceae bacterium]
MSIEQTLDPQLIEQTKQQIRALVAEIAQLSKTDVAPEEFYGQFLPRVVSALAAVGGAVWTLNPEGQLALQYQVNIQETHLRESEEHQAQHARLLYKVLSDGESLMVPARSGPGAAALSPSAGDETPAANPTGFLLLFGLLKTDLETSGLVEIFQRADTSPATQQGYLRFLGQMCELAGDFLKSHQLRHFSHRQTLWTQLEDFTRIVHASLDPRVTAYTVANEGRRLIECDRVSVAIRKGNKCKIEAVSGQDLFDKRSNTVRLLGKLATAVVATGEPIWYTGETRDLAPQVEDAVQEYVDEAHSKTVAVLPLVRANVQEEDDPTKREEPERPIGALIVEQIEDSRVSASLMQRADVVRQHSSAALANAMEHQNLFLMPVWRALGKTRWVVQGRTLPKTLTIAGAVVVLLLILIFWPAKFTLEAKGTLMPIDQQHIFTTIDGEVENLYVAHGDKIAKDKLLLKLRNTDLGVAMREADGKLRSANERVGMIQRALAGRLSVEERLKLEGEKAELRETIRSLEEQMALYRAKQLQLNVRSPIAGQVLTFDLQYRLLHRPVQRGQELLRVADTNGPFQLELHMPENHIGYVVRRQQAVYDRLRKTLEGLLTEDAHAKAPDAAAEDVDKTVKDELAKVSDEGLRTKIDSIYQQRFRAALETVRKDVTDPAIGAKLDAVLHESTYEGQLAKLDAIIKELKSPPAGPVDNVPPQSAKPAETPSGQGANPPPQSAKPVETPVGQVDNLPPQAAPDNSELIGKLESLRPLRAEDDRLEVSFILATEPSVTHKGRIHEIARSAEVRGDEGNTVLIKVWEVDKAAIGRAALKPGANATAKVDCGVRPLGYVLLYDLISWMQTFTFRYL